LIVCLYRYKHSRFNPENVESRSPLTSYCNPTQSSWESSCPTAHSCSTCLPLQVSLINQTPTLDRKSYAYSSIFPPSSYKLDRYCIIMRMSHHIASIQNPTMTLLGCGLCAGYAPIADSEGSKGLGYAFQTRSTSSSVVLSRQRVQGVKCWENNSVYRSSTSHGDGTPGGDVSQIENVANTTRRSTVSTVLRP